FATAIWISRCRFVRVSPCGYSSENLHPPSPLEDALRFVEALKRLPNYVEIRPGPRHWDIFVNLCRRANARGNLIPDAFLAALAIESGSEWITSDRDYGRFPELHWRHPLE